MSHQPSKKGSVPFSLRFTPEERRRLERAAAGLPLGTYMRRQLLEEAGGEESRRASSTTVVADHALLGKILAFLGRTRFARSLTDLAAAAKAGSLYVTPETEEHINAACRAVIEMREMLMKALGFRERQP